MSYHQGRVQNQAGALLLAWQDYKAGTASTESIDQLIEILASEANVKTLGALGDVVPFEPFKHFVIEETMPTDNVVVVRAGAYAVRDDGSTRTITRALVSAK